MNRLALRLLSIAALAGATSAFAAPPTGQSYKLIYADEFAGTTLDTYKWNFGYPWGSGRTHNHAGYADMSQVKIANGVLDLHAVGQRHPGAVDFWHNEFGQQSMDYTVGVINSQGKLNISEGYIEASLKLDASMGSWPAFWMLGNGWPPEIDIMEFPRGAGGGVSNTTNTAIFNYHYTNSSNANASYYKRDAGLPVDLTTSFNTFGLEWTPSVMRFSVNGQVRHTITDTAAIADAVNMYLLLNHAVDGWADTPANPSLFDAAYLIDYVRVYQRNTNTSATSTWQGTSSSGSWDTSANWTVQVPKFQDLTAVWNSLTQSALSVSWNNSRAVGGLRFNTNKPITLGTSAGSLQIANSGTFAVIESTAANTAQINVGARLDLWSDTRVINNSASSLIFSGKVVGNKQLLKGGTGVLQLLGNNEHTATGFYGGTNSGDSGIIRLSHPNALGLGTLNMPGTNNASQIVELTNFIQVNNDLTTGGRDQPVFLRNLAAVNTWAGDITIANSGGAYAIDAASGTLTLSGKLSTSMVISPSARIFTLQGNATGNITGTVEDGTAVQVGLAKSGTGTWSLGSANAYSAGTVVNDGKLLVKHAAALGSGAVAVNGGTLELQSSLIGAVRVPSLTIAATGKVELNDNGLIIDTTSAALATALIQTRADLQAGLIVSSLSVTDPRYTVGYASAAALQWTTFDGLALDADAIVIVGALAGDTNLDQIVDFTDLLTLAQGYGTSERIWSDGDFNFDGVVEFADLLSLAQSYGASASLDLAGFSSDFQSDWLLAQSLVPEPAGLSLIVVGAAVARRRR